MSAAVRVRFVTRGDYAEWLPLWEGYNEFYKRFWATALPDAITRVTWERFFDAYEPMYAMVARLWEARLVGLVYVAVASQHDHDLADVLSAGFVHCGEGARGKGVACVLIEAVYEQARLAGVAQVYWRTHATNATARRLYDQVAEESGSLVYKKRLQSCWAIRNGWSSPYPLPPPVREDAVYPVLNHEVPGCSENQSRL